MIRLIITLLLILQAIGLQAQDMPSVFASMPDDMIPQLESAWRKDLIDLYKSGKEAKLKNTMSGISTLKKLTDDYLLLQKTERSTLEMKLLPLINDTYVVAMITTMYGPVPDSHISFYTTTWQPLADTELFTPVSPEWFMREDMDRKSDAFLDFSSRLDMNLIKYELSADDYTLTASYTTPLYLGEDEKKMAHLFLKDKPKSYTWQKSRFE